MTVPKIDSYHFGVIVIDGQTYRKDVIITPDGVIANWWREAGHSLTIQDLDRVLADSPDLLVIGQGAYGRMEVPPETHQALIDAGIRVSHQNTEQACQLYNELRANQHVIAALHLTC